MRIPFFNNQELKQKADEFRIKHWGEIVPVEIEHIIESKLKMEIIPIPGLYKQCNADALISSDWRTIYVDNDNYLDDRYYNRLRFSLAHEIGHFILHQDLYASFNIKSFEDFYNIIDRLNNEYGIIESHANRFANFLLVPREKLEIEKAKVVGITVSKEQVELGQKLCQGLPVEIRLQDYRDLNEKFDHIVSLGMFEHVGYKNYRHYMEIVHKCLEDNGLFLLQTIAGNYSVKSTEAWIDKYIFPNSMLPSVAQIGSAIDDLFVLEDWHNFGIYYDRTLMAWYQNFINGWDKIKDHYSQRFFRMWQYYLLCCAGSFRARKNQLWQIVLSKNGLPGGYQSIR